MEEKNIDEVQQIDPEELKQAESEKNIIESKDNETKTTETNEDVDNNIALKNGMNQEEIDKKKLDNLMSDSYYRYIIEYKGDIKKQFEDTPEYSVIIIDEEYAILASPKAIPKYTYNLESTVAYVRPVSLYTLQETSAIDASQVQFLQLDLPLKLTGKGVIAAIIDTGIDYLNEAFMDEDGNTRIDYIWDQTIRQEENEKGNFSVPFGAIYDKNDIQNAINANKEGKSPYDIVPSKDELGHGTEMAGIIGARKIYGNIKGMAPECRFIVIKLAEDYTYKNFYEANVPIYNVISLFLGIEVVYRYSLKIQSPIVIFLPLGSNMGNHKGDDILELYIDKICTNSGIAIVTGTGNQRMAGIHTSGVIAQEDDIKFIELQVSEEQKNIWIEIWADKANIFSIELISPSGQSSGVIHASVNDPNYNNFIFEKTETIVVYFLPEELSGEELVRVYFRDVQPGIWKVKLIGELILNGVYNAWLPIQGITKVGTHFNPEDLYGTMTTPGTSEYIIVGAAYNENNYNFVSYSGMNFYMPNVKPIDVAAGSTQKTISINNTEKVVQGTSVSGAVVAGACILLFQWGIVDENDPNMYSKTIKTYLARGVVEREGDEYPNPEWGYGILNLFTLFRNIK